jgi:hypothetical protein
MFTVVKDYGGRRPQQKLIGIGDIEKWTAIFTAHQMRFGVDFHLTRTLNLKVADIIL